MARRTTNNDSDPAVGSPVFATTLWSVVRRVGESDESARAHALDQLCNKYWYPLYAFARREGKDAETAQDLTQGFFAHLLEKQLFTRANPEAGRLRSFLLKSFRNYIAQSWHQSQAQKRGGGAEIISIDITDAEGRYELEPIDDRSAEKIFERRWAVSMIERALQRLESEMRRAGKADKFRRMEGLLIGDKQNSRYAEIAKELEMSEGALRVAIKRLRSRYSRLFREEIAQTTSSSADFKAELRYVLGLLSA